MSAIAPALPPPDHAASPRPPGVKAWRWDIRRYDQATAFGWFRNRRLELIEGKVLHMAPQLEPHAVCISLASPVLAQAFGPGHYVRVQMPLRLGDRSKPEPDLAVVAGSPRDYLKSGTPTAALLVVEAADKTLLYDRGRKCALYAMFSLPDYWIVNLNDRQVEVYRSPMADPSHPLKFRYADVRAYKAGEAIAPLAAPNAFVLVDDLLP